MAKSTEAKEVVRWRVIGFRESVYQACAGAPVQGGSSCDKCGQGIRYVVTVKSNTGEVLEVGRDCAVTLEGGPELAEIRRAEREYEHECYLQSDGYKEHCRKAAEERRVQEERARLAVEREALTLVGLDAVLNSAATSQWEKDHASVVKRHILAGETVDALGNMDDVQRLTLSMAVRKAYLPTSTALGNVGDKIAFTADLEAMIPVESQYGRKYVQKFRDSEGHVFVWFSGAGNWGSRDIGKRMTLKGTVKAHKEYAGENQTVMTRCKAVA
jgi:hypothetical protein